MELRNRNLVFENLNLDRFSKNIAANWNISADSIRNYVLSNISMAIIRNSEVKKVINKLYIEDYKKYYNAAMKSSCINHIILTQGTLEQEIEGRKALGILLIAEEDYNLRNNIVNLLRKSFPVVFNAVKKNNKKDLAKRYIQMDEITRRVEARLDASLFLYFGIYRFNQSIDQGFFKSIIEDIKFFEFRSPITRDIDKELELYKTEIQEIKTLIRKIYGKLNNYKDILNSNNEEISDSGEILKNIFVINKIDINYLFNNSSFFNIDELILSYIKGSNGTLDLKTVLQTIINGIFIRSIIKEYKKSKSLYFENNKVSLSFNLNALEDKLSILEKENVELLNKVNKLEEEKQLFDSVLNNYKNNLNRKHNSEILDFKNRIKELEEQLILEKKYRNELNELREYVFKVNNQYIPTPSNETLDYYIARMKIIIIGGTKEWRRKFREKYPELRTLTGFNGNFDTNILLNYDYVFFYTGFMDHATYYRAINFIRTNQINFGYIGKTNIELVEDELINELEKI
ncbi:MAG: hypothetical protein AB6733_07540 [Clostridiaceae bacterium]